VNKAPNENLIQYLSKDIATTRGDDFGSFDFFTLLEIWTHYFTLTFQSGPQQTT